MFKSPSNSLMRSAARPYRPMAARSVRTEARLFKIRSLHSEHGTVVLDDPPTVEASPSTTPGVSKLEAAEAAIASPLAAAMPGASEPVAITARPKPSKPLPPGSRSSLMSTAGRKLIFATPTSVTYLDGSLPGDYGFDPLGLADPSKQGQPGEDQVINLRWLSYAELIHARWAMLAAAGVLTPEILGAAGIIPQQTALPWFEAGGVLSNTPGEVQGIPFVAHIPFSYWTDQGTLLWTMLAAMGFAELRRLQDYRFPGSMGQQYFLGMESVMGGSGDCKYPGGQFFNLFNMGSAPDSAGMLELKVKEIKNGRLAMVAWLGFMIQACTTHKGPVQNLLDHMSAPASNNVLANIGDYVQHTPIAGQVGFVLWLAAGFAAGALYKRAQDSGDAASVAAAAAVAGDSTSGSSSQQQQDAGNSAAANGSTV